MNRLFLKVFLGFWGTVLILGVSLVLSFVLGPKGSYLPWQNMQHIARRVVGELDAHGSAAANEQLRRLAQAEQLEACLFDQSGTRIAGDHCAVFEPMIRKPLGAPGRPAADPTSSVYRTLMRERSRTGQIYYLATQIPFGPQAAHRSLVGFAAHVALLLLVSSAVCYLLAMQLTRPILRLRRASTQIAEGKLDARVDATVERRGDEFGDLGRDFNAMAERIQDLLSSQRQLISDVSHEVRSPLARMNLALDLARRRLGNDPAFDRIGIDLEKLNEMIGRLLTIAKLESGGAPMERKTVELSGMVREIVEDARMEARERRCTIVCECAGEARINGDESLLRSAMENVIRNAVYYTHPETEIRVELNANAGAKRCALMVSDRGPGVPERDLEKIFKPFYRVAEARDRQSGGAGLGLAIASRVIGMHGGSIAAANREGGGLEVRIELPSS